MEIKLVEQLDSTFIESRDDVLFQVLDDEIVLLDMASGQYFGLNEVGALIWVLSKKGQSLGSIMQEILEKYEVAETELMNHVTPFLRELESEGLISRVQKA